MYLSPLSSTSSTSGTCEPFLGPLCSCCPQEYLQLLLATQPLWPEVIIVANITIVISLCHLTSMYYHCHDFQGTFFHVIFCQCSDWPFNITILTWYLASTMANSGRALLLGAFDTTFKTKRLEEDLKMPTWPSHVSLCWAFVSAAISITSARSGKDASTWTIQGLCWPPSYTATLSKRNPDIMVLMLANEAYTLLVRSSWWCCWCYPPDWLPDLLSKQQTPRRQSGSTSVLHLEVVLWGEDAMFTHTPTGQHVLMLTYRLN